MLVSRDDQGRPGHRRHAVRQRRLQAIRELKASGYRVTFYPFILMDVPPDNELPDPYSDHAGGTGQPAYPWRGRITCSPAAGYAGSPDKSAAAATQVSAFFGEAQPSDFDVDDERVEWDGDRTLGPSPDDPALRHLCSCGGRRRRVPDRLGAARPDAGPRRRDDLSVRGGAASTLAADVRAILGAEARSFPMPPTGRNISGTSPPTAAATCSSISIRCGPMRDRLRRHRQLPAARRLARRARPSRLRASRRRDLPTSPISATMSRAARATTGSMPAMPTATAQIRTPITDGAYGKPWVFRFKDLRSWWANAHHDRPGGVEAATPTAWVPEGEADLLHRTRLPGGRQGRQPAERLLRSEVGRDRRCRTSPVARATTRCSARFLEVGARLLGTSATNNPVSGVYGGADDRARPRPHAWAWDARPFPAFPTLADVWTDGAQLANSGTG